MIGDHLWPIVVILLAAATVLAATVHRAEAPTDRVAGLVIALMVLLAVVMGLVAMAGTVLAG